MTTKHLYGMIKILNSEAVATQHCGCVKGHYIIDFEMIIFMWYKFTSIKFKFWLNTYIFSLLLHNNYSNGGAMTLLRTSPCSSYRGLSFGSQHPIGSSLQTSLSTSGQDAVGNDHFLSAHFPWGSQVEGVDRLAVSRHIWSGLGLSHIHIHFTCFRVLS